MESVTNFSARSQISDVHLKYLAFGVQYNFEVDHSPCESYLNLQNVEMMLLCQGKTGILKGRMCKSNEDCERKIENCQRHRDIDLHICIRKIHF